MACSPDWKQAPHRHPGSALQGQQGHVERSAPCTGYGKGPKGERKSFKGIHKPTHGSFTVWTLLAAPCPRERKMEKWANKCWVSTAHLPAPHLVVTSFPPQFWLTSKSLFYVPTMSRLHARSVTLYRNKGNSNGNAVNRTVTVLGGDRWSYACGGHSIKYREGESRRCIPETTRHCVSTLLKEICLHIHDYNIP